MKKKILSILGAFLALVIITSTGSAGGNVKLSRVQFSIGSLEAIGTFHGLGGYSEGVTVHLVASGDPYVSCTNQGGQQAPGQNPTKVTANGIQEITADLITKKGTASLDISAEPGELSGLEGGCPNNNWAALIEFVDWTNATITVYDSATWEQLLMQNYTCETTRNPDNTGTVICQLD